jgi:hypothetical protein
VEIFLRPVAVANRGQFFALLFPHQLAVLDYIVPIL